jgi:hypothetical protein
MMNLSVKHLFGEILLDPKATMDDGRFRAKILDAITEALLYEMCHTYLVLYECTGCRQCCRDKEFGCHTLKKDNASEGGHGRQWKMLAMAIEQVSVDLLGIELRMRGTDDVILDLELVEDGWVPLGCDVRKFFGKGWLGRDEVLKAIRKELKRRENLPLGDPTTPEDRKRKRELSPTPPSDKYTNIIIQDR